MKSISVVLIALSLPLFAADSQTKTSSQSKKAKVVKEKVQPFRLFNPATMAKPVSTYSHVAEVTGGRTIYIAGQVGIDLDGKLVGPNDFRAQVEQVFKNIKAAVEAAGGDMNSLVKTNYYCAESVDPAEITALREIRDRYINTSSPPTSTFVVVKRLARPEYLIEVEAVAVVPDSTR
jgi:2-iminobutanoate/2-iminopropanoate deaminase